MQFREISDLGLIAGLISLGYAPLERKLGDKSRVIFVFESDDVFESLCQDYFNNRLDVDAQSYFSALKSVKTGIYQLQKGL